MENIIYAKDGSKIKITLNLSIEHKDFEFKIKRKPEQLDFFLNEEMKDPYLLFCEEFLISNKFFKNNEGLWEDRSRKYDNQIFLPTFFADNGKLRIKFGKIHNTLILEDLTLTSLEGLPTMIYPIKENKKNVAPGTIVLYKYINGQKKHVINVNNKDIEKYKFNAITLPYYEERKKKVDRWLNKEFDFLGIRNIDIGFFNWIIEEHAYTKYPIYERFYIDLERLYIENNLIKVKKSDWPNKFFDWIYLEKDENISNYLKSIFSLEKFNL